MLPHLAIRAHPSNIIFFLHTYLLLSGCFTVFLIRRNLIGNLNSLRKINTFTESWHVPSKWLGVSVASICLQTLPRTHGLTFCVPDIDIFLCASHIYYQIFYLVQIVKGKNSICGDYGLHVFTTTTTSAFLLNWFCTSNNTIIATALTSPNAIYFNF